MNKRCGENTVAALLRHTQATPPQPGSGNLRQPVPELSLTIINFCARAQFLQHLPAISHLSDFLLRRMGIDLDSFAQNTLCLVIFTATSALQNASFRA
jgi:hypothetical protein